MIMKKIKVCVGSSCFIEDSNKIIKILEEKIKENDLSNVVELSACFCMNNCLNRVSISVNDQLIDKINIRNIDEIFNEKVME